MSRHHSTSPTTINSLLTEQSELLRQRFQQHLVQRGHTSSTVMHYLVVLEHFTCWFDHIGQDASAVQAENVEAFLSQHLPHCRCPTPNARTLNTVRAALHQFLSMLGRDHQSHPWPSGIMAELAAYDAHLVSLSGLAASTRDYRQRYAGEFLAHHFGDGTLEYGRLSAVTVRSYVTHRAKGLSPASAAVFCGALRSFLRFLHLSQRCCVDLAGAIPGANASGRSAPPPVLNEAAVQQLLASFDRTTGTGKRDYAMCRCLVDLALRTSEVALLCLDDFDWHNGNIRVPACKSRHANHLPLPSITGEAIVDYLQNGRPATSSRALFVHHRALSGTPVAAPTVRGAIRRGFAKAGIAPSLSQVHRLRHSTATRLLDVGIPFKTIADILNHRCYDTTAWYLSVDSRRLHDVAMPWPGRQS